MAKAKTVRRRFTCWVCKPAACDQHSYSFKRPAHVPPAKLTLEQAGEVILPAGPRLWSEAEMRDSNRAAVAMSSERGTGSRLPADEVVDVLRFTRTEVKVEVAA